MSSRAGVVHRSDYRRGMRVWVGRVVEDPLNPLNAIITVTPVTVGHSRRLGHYVCYGDSIRYSWTEPYELPKKGGAEAYLAQILGVLYRTEAQAVRGMVRLWLRRSTEARKRLVKLHSTRPDFEHAKSWSLDFPPKRLIRTKQHQNEWLKLKLKREV